MVDKQVMHLWKMVAETTGDVGGRATDVEQIGFTLERHLEETFDGDVPLYLRRRMEELVKLLHDADNAIQVFGCAVVATLESE